MECCAYTVVAYIVVIKIKIKAIRGNCMFVIVERVQRHGGVTNGNITVKHSQAWNERATIIVLWEGMGD